MRYTFTAVFVDGEDGSVIAYVEELPGVYGQGQTINEAERRLRETVVVTILANQRLGRSIFGNLRVFSRTPIVVTAPRSRRRPTRNC